MINAQIIAARLVLTLGEIIAEAERQSLPMMTISTIHRYLKLTFVTLNRVSVIPVMQNTPPQCERHHRGIRNGW
jgi:hypothetical protein